MPSLSPPSDEASRPRRSRASRRDRLLLALPSLAVLFMMTTAIPLTETSTCFALPAGVSPALAAMNPVNSWGRTRRRTNAFMDHRCNLGSRELPRAAVFGGVGRRGAVGVGMVSPKDTSDVTSAACRRLVSTDDALLSAP